MKYTIAVVLLVLSMAASFLCEYARIECKDYWWNGVAGFWGFTLAFCFAGGAVGFFFVAIMDYFEKEVLNDKA